MGRTRGRVRSSGRNSEFPGRLAARPREARSHTRKGPRTASRTSGRAWFGPGAPHSRKPTRARDSGPPRPENRGPCCVRPLPSSTFPAPWLPGVVHARGRGEAGASVTHLRTGSRKPRSAVQTGKAPEAAADQLPNSRSCACGAAIAELPSFPSFKPPANGGPNRGNPRGPASPGGRRDGRAGRARARARPRARAGSYVEPHYFSYCGSELALSLNMLISQVGGQRSRTGKILVQSREGGFSLKSPS